MKSEIRNPKSERSPKAEGRNSSSRPNARRLFGFRHSDFFRISDFGFRISIALALLSPFTALPDTILNSKHNLSVSGPGTVKAATETEVCIFCHTPHRATGEQPLWNHAASSATYTPYSSSTLKATVGQPTGASRLCLSCHDGTVALGLVNSRGTTIAMQGGVTTMPSGAGNLGTDLSQTHPVSFVYDANLAVANGKLKDPSLLKDKVRL